MGNSKSYLKKVSALLGLSRTELRVLTIGLDAAGKTTILYRLKLGEVVTTIPTIGFNVETIDHKSIQITVWDVGGRDKIRPLYRHYFPNTQALIYVVDSNDRERMDSARDEMQKFLKEDELRDCIFLLLANKQDLENAMPLDEVKKALKFDEIKHDHKNAFSTVATTGDGLNEAIDWLSDTVLIKQNQIIKPLNETLVDVKHLTESWPQYMFKLLFS